MATADFTADLNQCALAAMSEDDRLAAAASASQAAASANSLASTLRSKASLLTNPAERSRMMQEAYNKELEAHGNSKRARILSSGTFQGSAGGAGIGTAVGMGLGTVTGTLVGAVATIPGVLVGGLVGAGVGVIHGPWIKLGGKANGKGAQPETKIPAEAVENGSVVVDQKTGQVKTVDKEGLERARKAAEQVDNMQKDGAGENGNAGTGEAKKEKKKPRKLEVRNKPKVGA
ncbi:hypothetical protein MBLNU13_g07308t1 [Cladosporium sp. NU13]